MSFALVGIGLYVRRNLHESPVFVAAIESAPPVRLPLAAVFRYAFGPMVIISLCMLTQSNMLQIFTVFGLVYGIEHAGAARVDMLNGMLIGNLVGCCLMAVYGHLSDRIGRRPLVIASMALSVIYADLVFFPALSSGNGWVVMFGVAGASAFIQPMIFGVSASYLAELIPDPRLRFTGVGFGASLGSLVSGFFPAIAQLLYQWTGTLYGPIGYYGLVAGISIFAVWKGRETRSVSLLNGRAE
jgi:MFS family permease